MQQKQACSLNSNCSLTMSEGACYAGWEGVDCVGTSSGGVI